MKFKVGSLFLGFTMLLLLMFSGGEVQAEATYQEDLIERGEYLTTITGCIGCHTPLNEDFEPITERLFAGGYPFDMGPMGVVLSKNLTPDPETGLGEWTDEEIERAIRTGVSRDGLRLAPVMPYVFFNNLADEDVEAIIAYLRTLEPVRNEIPRPQVVPVEALPDLPMQSGIVAPDPSDTEARAEYLFTAVLACTDCHTPLDPETGHPVQEFYFAGGQPYEGPWGTIYGGNITPDKETGIGDWSDEDIIRVLRTGIRPDGRHTVLMPWPEYKELSEEDMDAVIYYLRNEVPAVNRAVPAASLNEDWIEYSEVESGEEGGSGLSIPLVAGAVLGLIIIGGVAFLLMRQQNSEPPL